VRKRFALAEPLAVIASFGRLRVLDNRQPVLRAEQVGYAPDCPVGTLEVIEFVSAVKRCRICDDVVVDMRAVLSRDILIHYCNTTEDGLSQNQQSI
jgi:hypothetical protein